MSVVTTFVLFCGDGYEDAVNQIHAWLKEHHPSTISWPDEARFARIDTAFGGTKRPELDAFGAAYNQLDVEAFIKFVMSLTWEHDDDTLLVVRPQDGPTSAYRADSFRSLSET